MSYFEPDDDAVDDVGPDPVEVLVAQLPTRVRDYLIAAADAKGHSVRVFCRVPPSVARLIHQVKDSGKYPFRTQADIIRFCIVHGCKMLVVGHGIPSVWRQVETMMATLAEEEQQLQFLEFFNKAQQVIDRYQLDGAPGEARRVATMFKAHIDAMPETETYWRERYQTEHAKRWTALLDSVGEESSWDVTIGVTPHQDPA